MKSLVIYFSLEGHTRLVAELIAKELNADLVELQTVKEYPKKGSRSTFGVERQLFSGRNQN